MFKGKTFIALVLLISAVMCPLWSQSIFSTSAGVNLSYSQDSLTPSTGTFEFNPDNIAVGLELRSNITYFQLDAVGEVSVVDSKTLLFSGILSAGASVEILSLAKIGLTFGPRIAYVYTSDASTIKDESIDKISNGKNFLEAIKDGPVHVRLMVDIFAGPVITVGAAYTIPTDFTMGKGNWKELLPNAESFEKGQISFCVQMKLF